MPTLQVPLSEEEMAVLKGAADYRGMKLRALVAAWVEAGCPLADGPSNGKAMVSNVEVMPASTEHLELARRQVELLEQLVELNRQGQATTPHGGTSARRVSESVSGNAPRDSGFEVVDRGNPFGGAPREASVPEPARDWMALPKGEPDLAAIAPLTAGRKLYLEDGWVSFRSPVAVKVKLADGTVLAASAAGWTGAEVEITAPGGGWPGGEGNRGLKDVSAPVDAVEFLSQPELKEAAE